MPRLSAERNPLAVDVFSGAGGLSLGFEQSGFEIIVAADNDEKHTSVHQVNFPDCKTLTLDLSSQSASEGLAAAVAGRTVDVVIGGPPCQGFSLIGRRNIDDERNKLIFAFLEIVDSISPSYFVMENVPGMLIGKTESIFEEWADKARRLGYGICEPIWQLNANDFGVPQERRRVFVVGYKLGVKRPLAPESSTACGEDCQLALTPTVEDAISDLPNPAQYRSLLRTDRARAHFGSAKEYSSFLRGFQKDPCDLSPSRTQDYSQITASKRTIHSEKSRRRFRRTEQGATEAVSRFPRLDLAGISPTLRAGTRIGADGSSGYTAARPIHPTESRCITVREAARLHSFPDWFEFDQTIWHGFRQVGNSVPPLLARAVGSSIMAAINLDNYKSENRG